MGKKNNNATSTMTTRSKLGLIKGVVENKPKVETSLHRKSFPKNIKMRLQLQEDEDDDGSPSIVFQEDPAEVSDSEPEVVTGASPALGKEANHIPGRPQGAVDIHEGFVMSGQALYACNSCMVSFSNYALLQNHMKKQHGDNTAENPAGHEVPDDEVGQRVHLPFYNCAICAMSFTSNAVLNKHMRSHNREMPHICTICGKAFVNDCNLRMHSKSHTGEKQYKCHSCEKIFFCSSDLRIHIRITGEKPYKCSICGKAYSCSTNLDVHKRIHTGEKPFKCSQCGLAYLYISTLHTHLKSHSDSGDQSNR